MSLVSFLKQGFPVCLSDPGLLDSFLSSSPSSHTKTLNGTESRTEYKRNGVRYDCPANFEADGLYVSFEIRYVEFETGVTMLCELIRQESRRRRKLKGKIQVPSCASYKPITMCIRRRVRVKSECHTKINETEGED